MKPDFARDTQGTILMMKIVVLRQVREFVDALETPVRADMHEIIRLLLTSDYPQNFLKKPTKPFV